jgi:hypothetical protein
MAGQNKEVVLQKKCNDREQNRAFESSHSGIYPFKQLVKENKEVNGLGDLISYFNGLDAEVKKVSGRYGNNFGIYSGRFRSM